MNLSLYFLEEDTSKKYAGVELQHNACLTAALDTGECSVSQLGRYIYIWGKNTPLFILEETLWAPEPFRPVVRTEEALSPTWN
jgi:hypothetical protein